MVDRLGKDVSVHMTEYITNYEDWNGDDCLDVPFGELILEFCLILLEYITSELTFFKSSRFSSEWAVFGDREASFLECLVDLRSPSDADNDEVGSGKVSYPVKEFRVFVHVSRHLNKRVLTSHACSSFRLMLYARGSCVLFYSSPVFLSMLYI